MNFYSKKTFLTLLVTTLVVSSSVDAQRARFEDPFRTQTFPPASFGQNIIALPNGATGVQPLVSPNQVLPGLAAPPPIQNFPPATNIFPQALDPFGNSPQNFQAPQVNPQNQIIQPQGRPIFGQTPRLPIYQQPSNRGLGRANRWPSSTSAWPSQTWARLRDDLFPRLFERPRFRNTWLPGSNGNELDINETELATTLTIQLQNGRQPVRLTPGFTFNFWNGPESPPLGVGYDVPSRAYSAFLAADHITDPGLKFGLETNLTVGVYSDFNNVSSDSLRITGVVLGWYRLNQTNTLKIGVEYFDRIKTKMLPAVGIFVSPTPDVRLDIYFPRPRLAQRIPNFRNLEMWAYVGGEYGGGSWTLERPGGIDDQMDMNDVRAFVGIEWLGERRVTGFFEIGYVFQRELVFKSTHPLNEFDLQDTLMIRTGVSF